MQNILYTLTIDLDYFGAVFVGRLLQFTLHIGYGIIK